MPTLQVRDLPQELYDKLACEAAAEFRSLAQQTTSILDQHFRGAATHERQGAMGYGEGSPSEIAAHIDHRRLVFRQLDAMPAVVVPEGFPSVTEMLAEGREERDGRFGL